MASTHITMFKKSSNELGYVRCVISSEFIEEFTGMGFVDNFDKLPKKRSAKAKLEKVETDDSDQG